MKTRDHFWKEIPPLSLGIFLLGVFFIFGIIGSAIDVINMGLQSTTRYLVSVVLFGLFAIVYAISGTVLRRNSWKVIFPVMFLQMLVMGLVLRASPIPHEMGAGGINRLHSRLVLDAGMTIGGMVLAYVCFIYVFISEGRRYFAVHAEMELASEIHRVLVPDIEARIGSFELFGRSVPSGQVGGDLIDVVESGDKWIAYIADVSGHGVAPGVLMGMVKSAARMYLSLDEGSDRFLERLNSVLNPIRKPEMFVTMAFLAGTATDYWRSLGIRRSCISARKLVLSKSYCVRICRLECSLSGSLPATRFHRAKVMCSCSLRMACWRSQISPVRSLS